MTASFFLGSIPFGYLIVKWTQGRDIRQVGSGNVGATNVLRIAGKTWGVLTLLLDAAKGALAVLGTQILLGTESAMVLSAVLAVLGHMFTPFLHFRGGKGVATALGALLIIAPIAVLLSLLVFLLTVTLSRFISVGSMAAAISFPLWTVLLHYETAVVILAVLLAILILWRHSSNVRRLLQGTENHFSWSRSAGAEKSTN